MQHVWHVILYCFTKGKNTTERQRKVCAVCGEGAGTDRMCQMWFVKFRAGGFLLNDAPQSSTPIEVDSNQIETLINVMPHKR